MKVGNKTKRQRDWKKRIFYTFSPFHSTFFFSRFEEGFSHFNFVQGPTNYVANPSSYIYLLHMLYT